MTGYAQHEIIGRNCRFLQGPDRDQPGLEKLRQAIANRSSVVVDLKNYKKSGALFYNRLSITPLSDSRGRLIYFLGVQYDVTNEVLAQAEIQQLTRQLNARSSNPDSA
jgi:PAS domain S-box-containing protein